jgi:hypothetical protein
LQDAALSYLRGQWRTNIERIWHQNDRSNEESRPYEIHRVIGGAGLAFLIPPHNPMVRPPNSDSWTLVNHQPFDGKLENNFRSTTLHLGFSGYEFPMTFDDHGGRFVDAFFIEAVVSVHDSGRWVADLDVLSTMEASQLYSLVQQPTCKEASPAGSIPEVEVISLDNWEELLDPPRSASVVHAHGNWQARLVTANVSVMLGHPTIFSRGVWLLDLCCQSHGGFPTFPAREADNAFRPI